LSVPSRARAGELARSKGGLSGREAWFALNSVEGLGAGSLLRLARRFGSPEAALAASREELIALGRIGAGEAERIRALAAEPESIRRRIAGLERHGIRLVCLGERSYPGSLLALRSPPPLLYLSGRLKSADRRAVAVVGTRSPTASGARLARQFARALAREGWTVVSGLALGIDAAAHEGALESGGRTIAVVGCGLRRVYPPENEGLAARVARQGCLVSEIPAESRVCRGSLLARDRIQAGLCAATVVVQGQENCGSMVTAKHALACGRAMFAVPWECDPFAAGWEKLRRMGARRVNSSEELVRALSDLEREPAEARGRLL
jgi:DNA processing protein